MDNDSTRNGGPLSFADTLSPLERAALGLQASLSLFEVGKLTFPDNAKFQQSLVQTLISNAKAGNLPVYGNPDGWLADEYAFDASYNKVWSSRAYPLAEKHHGTPAFPMEATNVTSGGLVKIKKWNGDNCLVSRADYFAFLKTPLALGIPSPDHWLPPPAETSLPELPTSPARPASVAKGGAAVKPIAALLALLDEVDKRAAEHGAGFNRYSLPGTRAEFHKLAIAFNRNAFSKALTTFHDYLDGQCQFESGVKPEHGKGAAIWALFPEYPLKLG